MKTRDYITENYRKQVDELIDNQSDYESFTSLSKSEVEEIWQGISTEIDISEVWQDISSDLDSVMPLYSNSGILAKYLAAALIILAGMVPVKEINTQSNPWVNLTETVQNEQRGGAFIENQTGAANIDEKTITDKYIFQPLNRTYSTTEPGLKPEPAERKLDTISPEPGKYVNQTTVPVEANASLTLPSVQEISCDHTLKSIPAALPELFPGDNLKQVNVPMISGSEKLKSNYNHSEGGGSSGSAGTKKLSAGITTLFKNTWLLNRETFDGLKSESLNSSEIVFYPDFGLSVNYSLSRTWLLQADGFIFSNTGQEYLEYLYGHYSKKKITLRYSTIAISAKYKFRSIERFIPGSSVNLSAGGYFSVLYFASQKINSEIENILSQYGKYDYGIRLATEFEFLIFKQFSLAPGISISAGIPNIYKGSLTIPAYLKKTHNGSADFQLTLYYHFK